MQGSWIAANLPASIRPCAASRNAALSSFGRSRLPTCSARNGGVCFTVMPRPPDSTAPVDEACRLDARFKLLAQGARLEKYDLRRYFEGFLHARLDAASDPLAIERAPRLDPEAQAIQPPVSAIDLGFEVSNGLIVEHQVFQLVVVDIDAAHLEEPDRAAGMTHHRKHRPGTLAVSLRGHADEIAGAPAQE